MAFVFIRAAGFPMAEQGHRHGDEQRAQEVQPGMIPKENNEPPVEQGQRDGEHRRAPAQQKKEVATVRKNVMCPLGKAL